MAGTFINIVIKNVSSLILRDIGLIMGVNDEMHKISSTLTTIQAVVENAEDKQIESKPIRDWLCKVNAIAYEIDDILDECSTQASKLKQASSKFNFSGLYRILYRRKIGRRIKQVTEKLDIVVAERTKFHLREMPVDRPREVAAWRETGSLLNEPNQIFGREEDIEKIVNILVNDVRDEEKISVLPIIGMGGLGKTTVAQLVFNDERVKQHFDPRIWVSVSDNFDIKTLVKAMLESGSKNRIALDLLHLDALERELWKLLSHKRYLVVLDDVWNDEPHKWFELKNILSCGSAGASIIVTTRQRKIADLMRTLPTHCMTGLSDEHCWMLFKQRAFGEGEDVLSDLEVIGKEIVKKCGGVPLAAMALGGILRFKRMEDEWIYVRESNMWSLQSKETLIFPALRLSYHHLPPQLRQCFAYFSAFPKNHQISRGKLILLWMAHGYISSSGRLEVEVIGNEICDELVMRSLVQETINKHDKKYACLRMHNLVHDLAQSVMENKVPGIQNETNIAASSSTIREVCLREKTVFFPRSVHEDMDISSSLEHTSLRVLDASYNDLEELPPSIACLKHLRYLNLSGSEFRSLPNSLCSIWTLKILNLDDCVYLVALPKDLRYLRNLRHLFLERCTSLSEMPCGIRELTLLQTLTVFVVGDKRGSQLEELQCLNLGGKFEIRHLERIKDPTDAKRANLSDKKDLRALELSWDRNNWYAFGVDEEVLKALQPHRNLEYLMITGYSSRHFPSWMTNPNLEKIVEIHIKDCQNCRRLLDLGELPLLKRLLLKNVGVEYIIEDEVQSGNQVRIKFPSLKYLDLVCLPNLKRLSKNQESKHAFPNLENVNFMDLPRMMCLPEPIQHLSSLRCLFLAQLTHMDSLPDWLQKLTSLRTMVIESCTNVAKLPALPSLEELTIRGCPELERRCRRGSGEDWPKIAHIPNLLII